MRCKIMDYADKINGGFYLPLITQEQGNNHGNWKAIHFKTEERN